MRHARRWKLSLAQRADMWSRWKAGQSLHEIGRALGKSHVVIQFLLARHRGIAPGVRGGYSPWPNAKTSPAATVVAALSQHVRQLPAALRRSLTWDRGLEMAQHQSFTVATDVKVYFCDPQSP